MVDVVVAACTLTIVVDVIVLIAISFQLSRLGPLPPFFFQREVHLFYFIRIPFFLPSLDLRIFSVISASDVLIDVFNYLTIKI